VLAVVGVLMAALVALIAISGRPESPVSLGRTGPIDRTARPSPSPPLNDGWFVRPTGMTMRANDTITDQDMLPLYVDGRLADALIAAGFRSVRQRSYHAGTTGGGSIQVMEVDDHDELLGAMQRKGRGFAEPFPDVPEGQIKGHVLQVESTRAHDVFFHFRSISFFSDPYVVQVQMHTTSEEAAERRAADYACAEHELLQSRSS
jgi:hypothetical protein